MVTNNLANDVFTCGSLFLLLLLDFNDFMLFHRYICLSNLANTSCKYYVQESVLREGDHHQPFSGWYIL
jgi:hypothetical protein